MERSREKILGKYSGVTLSVMLGMTLIILQPMIQKVEALDGEQVPSYDRCLGLTAVLHEDPVSMNTIRSGNIVKTVHAEKEIFDCVLDQGGINVIADVTTYIEIYENIVNREIIKTSALVTTCLKEPGLSFDRTGGATVIGCESYTPSSSAVPVGSSCSEPIFPPESNFTPLLPPQEMNTVNKGSIVKTIEADKEIFLCDLDGFTTINGQPVLCVIGVISRILNDPECFDADKKVDVILFTDIYENLVTHEVEEVQFHPMRCVVLISDGSDELRDATVESCQFSSIQN